MCVILKVCNVREVLQVYNCNANYCCTFTPFDVKNTAHKQTKPNKEKQKNPTTNKTQTHPTPIPLLTPSLSSFPEQVGPIGRNMHVNREILSNFSNKTCRLLTLPTHRPCLPCNLNTMIATALLLYITLWS